MTEQKTELEVREEIRHEYALSQARNCTLEKYNQQYDQSRDHFDAWLADHDRRERFQECSRLTWVVATLLDHHPEPTTDDLMMALWEEMRQTMAAIQQPELELKAPDWLSEVRQRPGGMS